MGDPLFDTLFRSTAQPVAPSRAASDAPIRATGTRTRAGNAMDRTRTALLEGARRAVTTSGTKITMAQVAAEARVAKATLYNHFRTREAVLSGLLAYEVEALCTESADRPLPERLTRVAVQLSENPMLRRLAVLDPAVIARLGAIDPRADGWRRAKETVAGALVATGTLGGVDMVLRWLSSYLLSPAPVAEIAADVDLLLAALASSGTQKPGVNDPAVSAYLA